MSDNGTVGILTGQALSLRCAEIFQMSHAVSQKLLPHLAQIADPSRGLTYTFKHRHKGTNGILDKVKRKRTEGESLPVTDGERRKKLIEYNPEHVTDAWACRFITLYQSQIPVVVRAILESLEDFNRADKKLNVNLAEYVIYTNRPENDPLSITRELLDILDSTRVPMLLNPEDRDEVKRPPENKKSAYSSVHLVCHLPLVMDFPDRRGVTDIGKFEIQVRDIFEEGWGEIQHNLLYSQREGTSIVEGAPLRQLWLPHLNALKTFVDGCSQHASIIKQSYDFAKVHRIPTLVRSFTPRATDKEEIASLLRKEGKPDTATTIELAYDLLIAATDNEDIDQAQSTFAAAAAKFDEAISNVGTSALTYVRRHEVVRTVEYFLKIEFANCCNYSRQRGPDLLRARDFCSDLSGKFPTDATLRLRQAQLEGAIELSEATLKREIKLVEECLRLLPRDTFLGQFHWMELAAPVQLGYCHWQSARQRPDLPDRDYRMHLRQAIDATAMSYDRWLKEPEDVRYGELHAGYARKSVSNNLYYLACLRFSGIDTGREIREHLKRFQSLHGPREQDYFRIRDNLMLAHHALGEQDEAIQCAFENRTELRVRAEARARKTLEAREVEDFLNDREKPAFKTAERIMAGEKITGRLT